MAIKHSPGCGCCNCSPTTGGNVSYTAGTTYEIPFDFTKNLSLDLTSLFPESLWNESNPWGKIELKDSSGTTLHESIQITPNTDFSDITDFTGQVGSKSTFVKPTSWFYDIRGFGSQTLYELSDTTTHRRNKGYKYQEPGMVFFRIKSVSAGTFDKSEGYARSLIKEWKPEGNLGAAYADCENSDVTPDIYFTTQKREYTFFDNESSYDVNIIRSHRPDGDCNASSPGVTWGTDSNLFGSGSAGFSDNVHSQTITLVGSSSDGILRLLSSGMGTDTSCNHSFGATHNTEASSITIEPITSRTGDGRFQLETLKVQGIEGSSTDVRVIRHDGNSTAVDVVVAVGNTDVTLNFAAGDQYKSFSITHIAHDGKDFSTTPIPTNSSVSASATVNGGVIVLRDDHWEYGSDSDGWHGKTSSTQEFNQWNPFERDGWTDSDLSSASIRAFISMSHDGTLGTWSAQRLYMIGTDCATYPETNDGCPEHTPCVSIFPYHTQQYDIEVTLDANYNSLSIPDKLANAHDGCGTTVVYEAKDPDFQDYVWRWAQNFEQILPDSISVYNTDYYAVGHWAAQDSSVSTFDCTFSGTITRSNDYSTYLPEGYVFWDNLPSGNPQNGYDQPTSAGDTLYHYPVTSTTTPSTQDGPDIDSAYSLSSIEFTTENVGGWTTTDAIKRVRGSIIDLAGTPDAVIQLATNVGSGSNLGDATISGRLGTRVQWYITNSAYHNSIYEKYDDSPAVNHYVGQTAIPVASAKLLSFSFFGFQNDHPDLWYEVSGSSSDDGFYRIYWNGTSTAQGGPYTTADDGAGNAWSALPDETPVAPQVTYHYWYSAYTEDPPGTGITGTDLDAGYVRNVAGGNNAGATGTLSGTFIAGFYGFDYTDLVVSTSPETFLVSNPAYPTSGCTWVSYTWYPDTEARPVTPDELQKFQFNSDVSHFLARDPGVFQVPGQNGVPAGDNYVFDGTPTLTTGTTIPLDGFGDYYQVICGSYTWNGSSANTSYWDFNALTVWDGHYQELAGLWRYNEFFYKVLHTGGINASNYGPSYAALYNRTLTFRMVWLPCYNSMNFPKSVSLDGDIDIDDSQTLDTSLHNVMTGCTFSNPRSVKSNTLSQFGGSPDENYHWVYDGTVSWEVLDPKDFNISLSPYSPLWSKS